jgi:hypothetical protein
MSKSSMKMEAPCSFEASVNFFKATHPIPKVSNLHSYTVRRSVLHVS